MADFKNKFSWSKSRDSIFRDCKRKYFFNYYGSWGGWENSSPERIKKIYYLKKINTKEIWIGKIIHETIEYVLKKFKQGEKISLSHSLAILRKRLDVEYNQSLIKSYTGFPSKLNRFFEHEYDLEISEEEKKNLFEKAEKCLINFYNSDIFIEIRNTPLENWLLLEDFLSFDFEGNIFYLSIDFAMKKEDKIILYDWKTGKERTAEFDLQLMLYSLYVQEKFKISSDKIIARVFNLALNKVDDFVVDNEKLGKAKEYAKKSMDEMKSLLINVKENTAREEDFPKEEGFYCNRCNFKKICNEKNK